MGENLGKEIIDKWIPDILRVQPVKDLSEKGEKDRNESIRDNQQIHGCPDKPAN